MSEITYRDQMAGQQRLDNAIDESLFIPVSMLKPKFGIDGNQYYFLYGDNLQEGVAGFGDSPREAMIDFYNNFNRNLNGGEPE